MIFIFIMGYGLGFLEKGDAWGFLAMAVGFVMLAHPLLDPKLRSSLIKQSDEKVK